MTIPLDFSDVGGVPDEGIYRLRVSDVEIKPTKDKPENKNLVLEFTIVEPIEWMNFKIWDNVSLTPQARWRLQQVLEAITGEEWREDNMSLDPRDLLGQEFEAGVFHSDYQGRKIPKVKDYFKAEPEATWEKPSSGDEPF